MKLARSLAWMRRCSTAYISADLNGTTPASPAAYAISSQPQASLDSLQRQVKQGQLDILLVLERLPNQALRFTYDTNASATNDANLPQIQALAQQLSVLDTAHRLGLTPSQTSSLFAPPDVTVVYTQGTRPTNESIAGYVLGRCRRDPDLCLCRDVCAVWWRRA